MCSVDCGTHGVCIGGACRCEEGWTGAACDQRVCHPRCIEHGTCKDGKCECREGWNGEHCTIGRQTAGTETGTYCFIFINRRSIVMVVHCNRLFLQGHECSPTFPLPLQIPTGVAKGKARFPIGKGFPCFPEFKIGRKGTELEDPPKLLILGRKNAHAWEIVRAWRFKLPNDCGLPVTPFSMFTQLAGSLDPCLLATMELVYFRQGWMQAGSRVSWVAKDHCHRFEHPLAVPRPGFLLGPSPPPSLNVSYGPISFSAPSPYKLPTERVLKIISFVEK